MCADTDKQKKSQYQWLPINEPIIGATLVTIWEVQVEDKSDAGENPTLLVSRQLHSPGGILQGIPHSNPPQYIKVNDVYTNYANHILKINLYTCI